MCNYRLITTVAAMTLAGFCHEAAVAQQRIVSVSRIWDEAPHNAFTDLVLFQNRFYCTFREAAGHVPHRREEDGKIRIIVSEDGTHWNSVGLLEKPTVDLRDSKLSVTPDGRLMVLMGGSYYDSGKLLKRVCQVSFLDNQTQQFSEPQPVQIDGNIATDVDWLWRVTWQGDTGYGVVYQPAESAWGLHLVRTQDGVQYEAVSPLQLPGRPNESTVRFAGDGRMWIVVRNEDGFHRGHLGIGSPPFETFEWQDIGQRLGGPNMIQFSDKQWVLASRHYGASATTVVGILSETGEFDIKMTLPSGGDTSYPGLVVHDGALWVSYYSSHEDKTAIYLAQIPLQLFEK